MDLIALSRDAWRHKWVTIPIVALTFVLALWVLALKPSSYVATASYTLVPPPACPTTNQIAADPKLASVNCNNPYVSYGDMTVVADVLSQAMSASAVKQELLAKGVSPNYTIDTSDLTTAPIVDISVTGSSAAAATAAAVTTSNLTLQTLNQLQVQQNVVPTYRITAQELNAPNHPTTKLSSKLRDFIAIIVVGILGWFMAMSITKGLVEMREERKRAGKEGPEPLRGVAPQDGPDPLRGAAPQEEAESRRQRTRDGRAESRRQRTRDGAAESLRQRTHNEDPDRLRGSVAEDEEAEPLRAVAGSPAVKTSEDGPSSVEGFAVTVGQPKSNAHELTAAAEDSLGDAAR